MAIFVVNGDFLDSLVSPIKRYPSKKAPTSSSNTCKMFYKSIRVLLVSSHKLLQVTYRIDRGIRTTGG